jgi:hypothetical protein
MALSSPNDSVLYLKSNHILKCTAALAYHSWTASSMYVYTTAGDLVKHSDFRFVFLLSHV